MIAVSDVKSPVKNVITKGQPAVKIPRDKNPANRTNEKNKPRPINPNVGETLAILLKGCFLATVVSAGAINLLSRKLRVGLSCF